MSTPSPRRVACAALLAVTVLSARPVWSRVVDVWDDSAARQDARIAAEEGARLDAEGDIARRRVAVRRAIAADLAAGRIGPGEAADRFRAVGAPEDRAAGLAIAYALHHLPPAEHEAATRRWERELRSVATVVMR